MVTPDSLEDIKENLESTEDNLHENIRDKDRKITNDSKLSNENSSNECLTNILESKKSEISDQEETLNFQNDTFHSL